MDQSIFIFTHYLFNNYGEYKNYVQAEDLRTACIKLFKHFNNRKYFYEIVSLIANYFKLDDDNIKYNQIKLENDDDIIEQKLIEIINRLNSKYITNEDIMLDIMKSHIYDKDNIYIPKSKIKSLNHQISYMTVSKLEDELIT
jgi:hypothetical protein